MVFTVLVVVQVVVAIALIGLILVQHGKGADAGAAFGSGASGTVFGASGSANFLSHTTAVLATIFFLVSLSLAYLVNGHATHSNSVTDQLQGPTTNELQDRQPAPAAPAEKTKQPAAPSPDSLPK